MVPKFRGWHKELEQMIYGKEVCGHIEYTTNLIDALNTMLNEDDYDIEVMQSTGLKDKNGMEIFEGDILVYDAPKKYAHRRSMHEIAYADGRFFWQFLDLIFCQSNILYRDGYLIIGNIYENPELLEEEK
ncbi:YopX family protein [Enterococcus sp.]|uniref:YopX family protein n=1 Tax=Enterococcus sp. TaxID=35783 RepID=UPI0028AC1406|nr:YopX family protein [Enterococcus sp.]